MDTGDYSSQILLCPELQTGHPVLNERTQADQWSLKCWTMIWEGTSWLFSQTEFFNEYSSDRNKKAEKPMYCPESLSPSGEKEEARLHWANVLTCHSYYAHADIAIV